MVYRRPTVSMDRYMERRQKKASASTRDQEDHRSRTRRNAPRTPTFRQSHTELPSAYSSPASEDSPVMANASAEDPFCTHRNGRSGSELGPRPKSTRCSELQKQDSRNSSGDAAHSRCCPTNCTVIHTDSYPAYQFHADDLYEYDDPERNGGFGASDFARRLKNLCSPNKPAKCPTTTASQPLSKEKKVSGRPATNMDTGHSKLLPRSETFFDVSQEVSSLTDGSPQEKVSRKSTLKVNTKGKKISK